MPGYRKLADDTEGAVAALVREAEEQQRDGDLLAAVALLEHAISEAVSATGQLPAWACGRLAALYRTLSRYDDEVALLEHYCESCRTEDARVRFIARLSKARAIAERTRRRDSGAVDAVREVTGRLRNTGRTALRNARQEPRSLQE